MDKQKKELRILEMMAENEKTISQLYKTYSEKFPDYEDFWFGLSAQEIEHATWLYELSSKVEDGFVHFRKDRFDINNIKKFHDYVNYILNHAQKQEISLESALVNALSIEYNLIERKFFEVFKGDAEELKLVLKLLYTSTSEHRNRVKKAFDEITQ